MVVGSSVMASLNGRCTLRSIMLMLYVTISVVLTQGLEPTDVDSLSLGKYTTTSHMHVG